MRPGDAEQQLPIAAGDGDLEELLRRGRYLLVLGRSGTGKSVLFRRLHRLEAIRFQNGASQRLPVLLNAPIHLTQLDLTGALKDALRRDGQVELPDSSLDFLIRKGGFLILVDSLNELAGAADAMNAFLNRDANNVIFMASQTNILRYQDLTVLWMVEVTSDQAAAYLDTNVGPGTWAALAPGMQALTRNPQDLVLIAEVARNLGVGHLPSRRADLYGAMLEGDSALQGWVAAADPRLSVTYYLAFRMLSERRAIDESTLAQWTRDAVEACDLDAADVDAVAVGVRCSRFFAEGTTHDRLGRQRSVLTFAHELSGAFLAARYIRSQLEEGSSQRDPLLEMAMREDWQNVFFFVVDELPAAVLPDTLLDPLLATASECPLRIVAYALESKKSDEPPPSR